MPPEHAAADVAVHECCSVVRHCLGAGARLHLHLGHAFEHHEPADRFVHRRADREQTVVAQDRRLRRTERRRDALAAVERHDVELVVVEDRVVAVERARLLADRPHRFEHRRKRRAVGRVDVGGAHDVGARLVHRPVDEVRRRVDVGRVPIGVGGRAVGGDEHEVVYRHPAERDAVATEPEVVGGDRVARRDVAVAELAPPERAEHPVRQGQPLATVGSLRDRVVDLRLEVVDSERRHGQSVRRAGEWFTGDTHRSPGSWRLAGRVRPGHRKRATSRPTSAPW